MGFLSSFKKVGAAVAGGAAGYAAGGPMGAAAGAGAVLQSQGLDDAAKEAKKGTQASLQFQRGIYNETAPARQELLRLASLNPSMLQPHQQRGALDLERDIRAGLAASGSRGSPRSVAAGFDAMGRFRDRAIDANRQEQMGAVNRLASIGYGTAPGISRTYADSGNTEALIRDAKGRLYSDTVGTIFGAATAQNAASQLARLGGGG